MAGQLVRIDGRRLRLTNLDKVLYPETGTTKGEVIDYYSRVAAVLLPHVAGRPVTRKRWPEGVGTAAEPASSFFAKALEHGAPDWVPTATIEHSGGPKRYPLVADAATLVYLAQVASLELHVPQWRFAPDGIRGPADRLVLDLDPGPGIGLAECAEVARWARAILQDMGMSPTPVTSGCKGIHLYAALPAPADSAQVASVAHELARAIEADHGDLVVSAMSKAQRPGKVFVDWSQNNAAKTTVAPYSLRGRPHPTVAAPRTWDELDDPGLRQLELAEVLDRVARHGDPLASLSTPTERAPLRAYIAKRTAGSTPEPVPADPGAATGGDGAPTFVIQEHHATRLHWDFRLERDGVLVSWAVPKGVPPTSRRNSLAIMTEDHPLSYGSFEGAIPRGQYGGGKVWIWDAGTYELEKWRDDEIIATLHGRPGGPLGDVRLALIRTGGVGEKSSWLLHRTKTDAAGAPQPDGAPVVPHGKDEPAAGNAVWQSDRDAETPATGSADGAAAAAARQESASAPSAAPPAAVGAAELRPMLATAATTAEARQAVARWRGEAWAELKWDGIRALGVWDGERLQLRTRRGNLVSDRYPELTGAAPGLTAAPAVVDGEIVALDASGRPSFATLQQRMNLVGAREIAAEARRTPVRYFLFDALVFDGDDVTSLPLRKRRALLERAAADAIEAITVPPVFDDLDAALETAERLDLEGVVVKRPGSAYRLGARSADWLKLKRTKTQEVVVGGLRPGHGNRSETFGSLLLGLPAPEGLRYVGRVGTGFSDRTLSTLLRMLQPLRTAQNPFVDVPAADARDALWVEPRLVGEVEYGEFTPGGILRHSRWRGLRPDKEPAEVVRE